MGRARGRVAGERRQGVHHEREVLEVRHRAREVDDVAVRALCRRLHDGLSECRERAVLYVYDRGAFYVAGRECMLLLQASRKNGCG